MPTIVEKITNHLLDFLRNLYWSFIISGLLGSIVKLIVKKEKIFTKDSLGLIFVSITFSYAIGVLLENKVPREVIYTLCGIIGSFSITIYRGLRMIIEAFFPLAAELLKDIKEAVADFFKNKLGNK